MRLVLTIAVAGLVAWAVSGALEESQLEAWTPTLQKGRAKAVEVAHALLGDSMPADGDDPRAGSEPPTFADAEATSEVLRRKAPREPGPREPAPTGPGPIPSPVVASAPPPPLRPEAAMTPPVAPSDAWAALDRDDAERIRSRLDRVLALASGGRR